MWFFSSPKIVFGDDALEYLREIQGRRALIVTDGNLERLGFVQQIGAELKNAEIDFQVFADVEQDPSLQTVKRGAEVALAYQPDWLIGLGGGSVMDAAKAIWVLYVHPDKQPDAISPTEVLNLRDKARLIAIPTTSGTGAEVTWGIVLTDVEQRRKIALGSPETMPDVAILNTAFVANLPPGLTADTGMDALTHAVEGYTSNWRSDFTDAPALSALRLIFEHLPRVYRAGSDIESRACMLHAATLASLSFGNAMAGLAHSMGHAAGALFHIPHGRAVGLFLPYTMEYLAEVSGERYAHMARSAGIASEQARDASGQLIHQIRSLARSIDQPLSVKETGLEQTTYEHSLPALVGRAENEVTTVTIARIPNGSELEKLFLYAYEGKSVDF